MPVPVLQAFRIWNVEFRVNTSTKRERVSLGPACKLGHTRLRVVLVLRAHSLRDEVSALSNRSGTEVVTSSPRGLSGLVGQETCYG